MTCSELQQQSKSNRPLSSVLWLALFAVQCNHFPPQSALHLKHKAQNVPADALFELVGEVGKTAA
jgi:hypothetical protein